MPIRVLSVEDHPVVREGLSTLISSQRDMEMVAQVATGEEAVAEYGIHRPDVTLMDIRLPGMSGTEAMLAIRARFPEARVVMLTTADDRGTIQEAMQAGAAGYLLKSMDRNELFKAIRSVHAGERYIPREVADRMSGSINEEQR